MNTTKEKVGWGIRGKGAEAVARCAELCRATARKLNAFQDQIAGKIGAEIQAGVPCPVVMQAVNEAHALAWTTSHPLLFLPDLAEEKINLARQWADRQREILDR